MKLTALLCLFYTLIFTFNSFAQEKTVFQIGVIQSLTGIAAEDGKTTLESISLAQKEINNKSPSYQLELIIEDD